MCSRIYLGLFIAFSSLGFFFFPLKAQAVSVTILDAPATITQDNFTIIATISGALSGTNYLRIDLYKDGTTNYFGETFNKTSWYNGSDGTQYLLITIPDDLPVTIQGRIGSPTLGEFDGTGNYKLRVRRYTKSGNSGSGDTMDSVYVNIIFPTPTPTPIPPTVITPTSPPITKPMPTPTPKVTYSSLLTKTPTLEDEPESTFGAVLGTMSADDTFFIPTSTPIVAGGQEKKGNTIGAVILIIVGFLLLAACAILIVLKSEKGQNIWKKFFPQKV